jgi:hypothetical protein
LRSKEKKRVALPVGQGTALKSKAKKEEVWTSRCSRSFEEEEEEEVEEEEEEEEELSDTILVIPPC